MAKFFPLLDEHLSGVRYESFVRAQQLVPAMTGDADALPSLEGATIADVLNAAWLARLDDLEDRKRTTTVERRAVDACRAI